ncbi:MAG: L-serine ammonia-lyase [Armatimonadetes bacterium]|nr:L-serine ammonia-lyase [Armatimonadota bacterium]
MFKVGVGPSSSHTMGPWRAAERFLRELPATGVQSVQAHLYGSLAKTGIGHGTDLAVLMGLQGEDPETCVVEGLLDRFESLKSANTLRLGTGETVPFDYTRDVVFHFDECLLGHPNGVRFLAMLDSGERVLRSYYSVGGGFVVEEGEGAADRQLVQLPYPIDEAAQLSAYCERDGIDLAEVVFRNELTWRSSTEIRQGLARIWTVMRDCIWRGCRTEGILPGGLGVVRRAAKMATSTLGEVPNEPDEFFKVVDAHKPDFRNTVSWVSCFALAVNEENAAFGRVVTAPTNGAAGVIPAVLMYALSFLDQPHSLPEDLGEVTSAEGLSMMEKFLLVSGEIGSLFKKGATISAAMGGCQAEIGVSSAMAAAALCYVMGGDTARSLMAAEIAMEHHLGMTCDPIGGLVQAPCIERNTMGAMKAITAAQIALASNPEDAKVSLDDVIRTMWQTALDMNHRYKETSEGGLAVNVSVAVAEC